MAAGGGFASRVLAVVAPLLFALTLTAVAAAASSSLEVSVLPPDNRPVASDRKSVV